MRCEAQWHQAIVHTSASFLASGSLAVTSAVKSFLSSNRSPMIVSQLRLLRLPFASVQSLDPSAPISLRVHNQKNCNADAPCSLKLALEATSPVRCLPSSCQQAASRIEKQDMWQTQISHSTWPLPPPLAPSTGHAAATTQQQDSGPLLLPREERGRGDAVAMENSGTAGACFC